MSAPRPGACQDPGPSGAHCTDYPGHRYSCYDAGDDVSFNERQMREDGIAHGPCEHCDREGYTPTPEEVKAHWRSAWHPANPEKSDASFDRMLEAEREKARQEERARCALMVEELGLTHSNYIGARIREQGR